MEYSNETLFGKLKIIARGGEIKMKSSLFKVEREMILNQCNDRLLKDYLQVDSRERGFFFGNKLHVLKLKRPLLYAKDKATTAFDSLTGLLPVHEIEVKYNRVYFVSSIALYLLFAMWFALVGYFFPSSSNFAPSFPAILINFALVCCLPIVRNKIKGAIRFFEEQEIAIAAKELDQLLE